MGFLGDLIDCGPSAVSPAHLLSGSWGSGHGDITWAHLSPATQAQEQGLALLLQAPCHPSTWPGSLLLGARAGRAQGCQAAEGLRS